MIGRTLSHFRITAKLGEGGMGEVYRAEDTKLGREVAIKVLPEAVTGEPERLARFEREAKLLASLNHPNIAGIFEVGEDDGVHFLAMELAEGEDLADRLQRGAFPIDEALTVALQVTHALEAAHEQGIVHRDLKPANVKLTSEDSAGGGVVKVLDFGLAKAWDEDDDSMPDLSMSPTLTAQMTQVGVILGTAAYMSPEQAKGKRVDKRADIWAFGVLLWEMLTGKRLFEGESTSEVLASVLMTQPDLDALPPHTPPRIRRLLERCLRREPGSRLRDIGDARIVIEEALAGHEWTSAAAEPARKARWGAPAAGLVALGLVLGWAAASLIRSSVGTTGGDSAIHASVPLPPSFRVDFPDLSRDGRTAVFVVQDLEATEPEDRQARLFVRHLDSDELHEVEGSNGIRGWAMSPDSRWLAFVAPAPGSGRRQLSKLPLDLSGPAVKLADWPPGVNGEPFWPTQDEILGIRIRDGELYTFPARGGAGQATGVGGAPAFEPHSTTPDGNYILGHQANFETGEYREDVMALDWRTGAVRRLIEDGSYPVLAPGGFLVFGRRDSLLAARIDIASLEVTGGAVSIMDGLWSSGLWTASPVSISSNGRLLYLAGRPQGDQRRLAFLTDRGEATDWSEDRLHFNFAWVSPDGELVATQIDNVGRGDALLQIRVSPIDRPRLATVATVPGMDCQFARWSPGSSHLAVACTNRDVSRLYLTRIDAPVQMVEIHSEPQPTLLHLVGFTADGANVIAMRTAPDGAKELISVPSEPGRAAAAVIPLDDGGISEPEISPDGLWLAYISDRSGAPELVVRRLFDGSTPGPRQLAASNGRRDPIWSKGAGATRQIYYLGERQPYSVEMRGDPVPTFSDPEPMEFDDFKLGIRFLDSLPGGGFMAVLMPDTERGSDDLRLVLDWGAELRRTFAKVE